MKFCFHYYCHHLYHIIFVAIYYHYDHYPISLFELCVPNLAHIRFVALEDSVSR